LSHFFKKELPSHQTELKKPNSTQFINHTMQIFAKVAALFFVMEPELEAHGMC
jgi:hypothetical protein